jgi:hypothetical protein
MGRLLRYQVANFFVGKPGTGLKHPSFAVGIDLLRNRHQLRWCAGAATWKLQTCQLARASWRSADEQCTPNNCRPTRVNIVECLASTIWYSPKFRLEKATSVL